MPEFLAEAYAPRGAAAPGAAGLARARGPGPVPGRGRRPRGGNLLLPVPGPYRWCGRRGDDRRAAAPGPDHPGRAGLATGPRARPAGSHRGWPHRSSRPALSPGPRTHRPPGGHGLPL